MNDSADNIRFYRVNEQYGFMSNFSPHPIELDDLEWPTSEHYFQAQKFEDGRIREMIRAFARPYEAAEAGRRRDLPIRRDWDTVKLDVMRTAVRAKFVQHADIRRALLETGGAHLVEHTSNDAFWGDGGDGKGQNWLGRILMEVRAELQSGS